MKGATSPQGVQVQLANVVDSLGGAGDERCECWGSYLSASDAQPGRPVATRTSI